MTPEAILCGRNWPERRLSAVSSAVAPSTTKAVTASSIDMGPADAFATGVAPPTVKTARSLSIRCLPRSCRPSVYRDSGRLCASDSVKSVRKWKPPAGLCQEASRGLTDLRFIRTKPGVPRLPDHLTRPPSNLYPPTTAFLQTSPETPAKQGLAVGGGDSHWNPAGMMATTSGSWLFCVPQTWSAIFLPISRSVEDRTGAI